MISLDHFTLRHKAALRQLLKRGNWMYHKGKLSIGKHMTREQYIDNFVVNFVSVWTAINYNEFCAQGKHEALENPPFEDAVFLAQKTWDKFKGSL